MAKFNFDLLRTFILNFWYIHSKRRKKYICTRYPKRQFIYPNKKIATNSLILFIFSVTWPYLFNIYAPEDLKIYHLTAASYYLNARKRLPK